MRWPLRDMLCALMHRLKNQARESYQREVLIYTLRAPYVKDTKPKLPDILKK